MIRRLALILLLASVAVLAAGCSSKKQAPPAAPSTQSMVSDSGDRRPTAAPPPTQSAPAEADIWSADLDTLNEYLRREGLLGEVYFEFDRYDLSEAARDRLERNARFLKEHPELLVTIEGHCDERGTAEYNLALGERRAAVALSTVQTAGVAGSRLQRLSYGKERPVCAQSAEGCWSKNRRASFVVTGRLGTT